MKTFYRFISFSLAIILIISAGAMAFGLDPSLNLEERTSSYLLGDFESGRIFESYNIDEPLPIASVSKLMTYLVVMEEARTGKIGLEDRVTITDEMEEVGGSHYGLVAGEVLTISDLLKGLMVVSGNDAAYALAIKISGSEAEFVSLMNAKAKELGYERAAFYNSSGLQEGGHQNTMTTREVFQLSRYIIKNYPEVLEYSKISMVAEPERHYSAYPTLPEMGLAGVDGLKTGYTEEAGYCLVSTIDVNNTTKGQNFRLISVVMGTDSLDERRDISQYFLEYGLEAVENRLLIDENLIYKTIRVNSAENPEVAIFPAESYRAVVPIGQNHIYDSQINEDIKAPIVAGTVVGSITLKADGEDIKTVDLVVKDDIEKAGILTRLVRWFETVFEKVISMIRS